MSNFLAIKKVVLAKLETSYGSDPTPTPAANTIDCRSIECRMIPTMSKRPNVRADMSPVAGVASQYYYEIKFECDIKGSGSAGTAPQIGDLLQACGMSEAVDAGSSVVYTPYSVAVSTKSVTLYYYELGDAQAVLRKITGARGTWEITGEAGKPVSIVFTFKGIYNAPSDVSNPTGMVYESTLPPIFASANFEYNSVDTLVVRSLTLTMNNNVALRPDINSAAGVYGFQISSREPSGNFKPEAVLLATQNYDTLLTANTEVALTNAIGGTAGNILTITAPKCQLQDVGSEEQDDMIYRSLPFIMNRNSGNDEIVLTFS